MLGCNTYHIFCKPILAKSSLFEHTRNLSPRQRPRRCPVVTGSVPKPGQHVGLEKQQALYLHPSVLFNYFFLCKELPFTRVWLSKDLPNQSRGKLEQKTNPDSAFLLWTSGWGQRSAWWGLAVGQGQMYVALQGGGVSVCWHPDRCGLDMRRDE